MTFYRYLVLFGAAVLAGAVNAVAGGGTLLTFPSLLAVGIGSRIANATSTVALWPGQLSSLWGYRRELGESRHAILRLAVPSLIGGGVGAVLLLHTSQALFDRLVPFLILGATLLFMVNEPISRWLRARTESGGSETAHDASQDEPRTAAAWAAVMVFQLLVGIYGGYFGAGIGILMLAALGLMGFKNIHRMNGLKNINGLCINAVAATLFIVSGLVDWHIALLMATGSIVGGYGGAGTAQKIGQQNVRRLIIAIGFCLTLGLLLRRS
jgi:uncharacterized membrane protein YfcA